MGQSRDAERTSYFILGAAPRELCTARFRRRREARAFRRHNDCQAQQPVLLAEEKAGSLGGRARAFRSRSGLELRRAALRGVADGVGAARVDPEAPEQRPDRILSRTLLL